MTDKKTEALKLAQEAIDDRASLTRWKKARDAIREALAEQCVCGEPDTFGTHRTDGPCLAEQPAPQQEPVAWMDGYRNIYSLEEKATGCPEANIALVPMANHKKTSGSPINELQCVCGAVWLGEEMVHLPEKRQPASKPWAGLVMGELPQDGHNHEFLRGAAWAEANLREKNA